MAKECIECRCELPDSWDFDFCASEFCATAWSSRHAERERIIAILNRHTDPPGKGWIEMKVDALIKEIEDE